MAFQKYIALVVTLNAISSVVKTQSIIENNVLHIPL
jgi:hypothetical protein